MTKKCKKIIILVFVSMIISLLPVNTFNNVEASSTSISQPILTEEVEYSDFFDKLTTFINEKIGNNTEKDELNNYLKDKNFEKAIAQREFIRKAGVSTIAEYASTKEKKNFINWVLNSTEAMNLFLEGGEPDTEYSKAFNVWFEIFTKDSDSHTGYELRLAIAAAMKFGNGVPKWYTSRTLVTPYERYEYYKVREAEGIFPTSMKTRTIWELRNTIKAPCSNWDLDYIRDVIHKDRYNEEKQKVSVKFARYSIYSTRKDENGNPYRVFGTSGDKFFGPDATIKEVHEIGGVCGTLSKLGSITNNAFGIPAFNIGQPKHAAFLYHLPTTEGKWEIGNNMAGWGRSVVGKRTYIPYTNYPDVSNKRPAYWFAYEESREDEESLHRSHQLKWIANALTDYNKAQAVRKVAVEVNKCNLDIWKDSINAMKKAWSDGVENTRIPSDKMTAKATSSNSSKEDASKVLDGNKSTIWHTKRGRNRPSLPQSITLSFDKEYEISKFQYLPRTKGRNGIITEYNFYTSVDGEKYELVSHGKWSDNSSTKTIEFKQRNAKYIKLEALKGHGGYATASELRVYRPLKEAPISIEERVELLNSLMNKLNEHPRPVYDMFKSMKNLVLKEEISREEQQDLLIKLDSIIMNARDINYKQGQAARIMRFSMAGDGLSLADFNFNGEKAGVLVGSKTDTEYSLDGGKTWKPITEENMKLTPEEIESITAEDDIKLRIKGTDGHVSIYIEPGPSFPKIHVNDDINKIFGLSENVAYSIDEGKTWTKYKDEDSLPDLTGDLKIMFKIFSVEKTVASEIRTFNFTSKVNPEIILPSDIESITANAPKDGKSLSIESMYDGNINSCFYTDKRSGQKLPHSVTLELKEPSDIYKLEYVPKQDGYSTGRIIEYNIYTSSDGENFTLVSKGNWSGDNKVKTSEFSSKNIKYIKLEGLQAKRNYICIAELRLYKNENLTPNVSFNFDNSNQGILIGSNTNMEYSIDNGETWKNVTKINMTLPEEDFININPESIIKVRFKNTTETTEISFTTCEEIPNVEGDDSKNTISGLDDTMEFSTDNGGTWTAYNGKFNVGLRGNVDLYVRYKATGTTFASEYKLLKYIAEETIKFDERVTYKFISKATGRSIDVKYGSKEDNAEIKQYRATGTSNQIVNLVNISGNQYKIVMRNSSKVLAPKDLSSDDGAALSQTTYTESDIQKWEIVNLGNDEYEIINAATRLAITANSNRSAINISKLVHSDNQVWTLKYAQNVVFPEVSFSFVGENARKLMGSNKSMEYSIDGGETWKSVSRSNTTLYTYEINRINSQNGIKIRVKGNAGITNIQINDKPQALEVKANDNKNIIEGINSSMEYSKDDGKTWIKYSESNPVKFLSDVDVLVRTSGDGVTPPGESKKLSFTSKITISLYKEFDPMNHITVKDSEGKDISSNIEVVENTVDVNQKGMYSVSYRILNGEEEKIITKEVEVVSDLTYLSDISYKSAKVGWGKVSKDTNINGRSIVLYSMYGKDTFEKGIGAHAPSQVVYDIKNKGYTNFESYIGLNQNAYNTNGSVIFKVYVDGTLKYNSGVMAGKTPYKYVDVNIKGAKEVKLIVDSNGKKRNDYSIWADAKFVSKDSAPLIEATNIAYEKDDEINFNDILRNVKATDVEDGDLTSKVTYTTNYKKGSTGNFDIVYSVKDSEGYETEKTVKLIVVNSSIYVSDTNWVSAKSGWGRTKKDLTVNSKKLILWDGSKEVTYEKGIGTHSHSETIYNLEGKDYGYFTSYVGGAREGNYRTSVEFKVYVDGKLKAETGVMKRDTAAEFIKVNIAGAKQLKLVVTEGGNGKGNDTAIWADAKFLMADENIVNVDTIKLQEVIKEVEDLRADDYEKETWDNLQEKITVAKSLLSNEEVEQSEIDKAAENIKTAISDLVKFIGENPVIYAEDLSFYKGDDINFDDILSKVTATDEEDGDISLKITYTTNYVEDKTGEFEIVYAVIDSQGNQTTKKVKLEILEVEDKFIYASDLDWIKATTQWKKVQKDKSIKGNTLRLWDGTKEVSYKKGIGTHAHSEVIYDLEGKDFKYFTSYIGVNRTADHRGSVIFKVFLDDKLAYTSEVMNRNTPFELIEINVQGVNNIKLVVEDGGNGNASDHANWADTKFLMTDENVNDIDTFEEEAVKEEESFTEEEAVKEEESLTEEEAVKEEESLTEDEAVKEEESLTEEEAVKEEESLTEDEAVKEEESLTEEEDIKEEESLTEDEAVKEEESLTEDEAVKEEESLIEDEAVKEEESLTEDEAVKEEDINTDISNFIGQSPVINAEDVSFFIGDIINFEDILSKVTISDSEDGDLSSKIKYTTNYVENQTGEFEIIYSATDSHGNKTTKKVKLEVKEKDDENVKSVSLEEQD